MKITVGKRSYFISPRGVIRADELKESDRVLGVNRIGKDTLNVIERVSPSLETDKMVLVSSDHGIIIVSETQVLWTNDGPRTPRNMEEALVDTYSGSSLEVKTIQTDCGIPDKRGIDKFTKKDAYVLGIFTRIIHGSGDGIIIRVYKDSQIRNHLDLISESRLVTKKQPIIREGTYWDWIKFYPSKKGMKCIPKWNIVKEAFHQIRSCGSNLIQSYTDGCLDVRRNDQEILFGFGEQDLFSFCCTSLTLISGTQFYVTPSPLYSPCGYIFENKKQSFGRVRSVVPYVQTGMNIEFSEDTWAPYVNGFLPRPS